MKSLFARTLIMFLGAFAIFILIISVVFLIGLDQSVTGWNDDTRQEIEASFSRYLATQIRSPEELPRIADHGFITPVIPERMPVFIFAPDQTLLFACRNNFQMGMLPEGESWEQRYLRNHRAEVRYNPISTTTGVIGYFHIGQGGFTSNAANLKLISSISRTLWIGIVLAFLLSFLLTLLFSGQLARTAGIVAEGINKIADGQFDLHVPETGARELIRIARNANRLGQELKKEAELRSQWSQDITHDLRTPITALKAQMEGMADGVLDLTPTRISLNLKELARIEQLVEDLGMLTRLESPEMRITAKPVLCASLLQELENRFAWRLNEKQISFYTQSTAGRLPGDENLLLRALSNILDNAIRHTPPRGIIKLTITTHGRLVELSLLNEGEIIPREELDKLFDRLYRGEYARNTPGTGLGLSITKKIVELHQGSIRIDSRAGLGTCVTITLPAELNRVTPAEP